MTPAGTGRGARKLGYRWENDLTRRISAADGLEAMRIGSPSAGMPDIVAYTDMRFEPRAWVIECKSTSSRRPIYVRRAQVEVMKRWLWGPLRGKWNGMMLACRWTARGHQAEWFYDIPQWCETESILVAHPDGGSLGGVRPAPGVDPPEAVRWPAAMRMLEGTL